MGEGLPNTQPALEKAEQLQIVFKGLKTAAEKSNGIISSWTYLGMYLFYISWKKKKKFQDVSEKPRKGEKKKKEGRGKERKQI